MSWASKRQFFYGGTVFLVLALIVAALFFKLLYRPPTCFDGKQNGDEAGVDCGGSCQYLCTSDSLTPITLWSKVFNVSGNVYTAVAYVENPNVNSKNNRATYQFRILDENHKLITTKEGETFIPRGVRFAVFEPGLVIKNSKPKTVEFEFTEFSPWQKDATPLPEITINHGELENISAAPRIAGTVSSQSFTTIPHIELTAFVLDSKENVIAASRTFVDNLAPSHSQDFVFTWPKSFDLGSQECSLPVDIALVLGTNTFSLAKETVANFLPTLSEETKVSIGTFDALFNTISPLSKNKQTVASLFNVATVATSTTWNMALGLESAFLGFSQTDAQDKKAIILFANGFPTDPKKANVPDNPSISAQLKAQEIKNAGVAMYTLDFSTTTSGFLKTIASDDNHYTAITETNLSGTLNRIFNELCARRPSAIHIIYRLVP